MITEPVEGDPQWLEAFFHPGLSQSQAYHLERSTAPCKLDQNENPFDWPDELREKVLKKLMAQAWNRYPEPYSEELHALLADDAGLPPDCVLAAPGSNYLLSCLISLFAPGMKGPLIVARPSFPLYEQHCRISEIPCIPWELNDDMEYCLDRLPEAGKGSVILFASPNNPVGNALSYEELRTLLSRYPDTMVIADEAYYDFSPEPYTPLLGQHHNLILVRTLSKAAGAAGIRLGYVLGSRGVISSLKKMVLPYLLNHFTIAAVTELLKDPDFRKRKQDAVLFIHSEKARITEALEKAADSPQKPKIFPSHANFLHMKWASQEACERAFRHLLTKGILVRNISKALGLTGCLRVTAGSRNENDQLIAALLSLPQEES